MAYSDEIRLTDVPANVSGSGRAIVVQPTFEELKHASDSGSSESVSIKCVAVELAEDGAVSLRYADISLHQICDLVYDVQGGEIHFTGRSSFSYEKSSYNQSSMITSNTYYRVVLRASSSESVIWAISKPH